jgi:hypothetical protein
MKVGKELANRNLFCNETHAHAFSPTFSLREKAQIHVGQDTKTIFFSFKHMYTCRIAILKYFFSQCTLVK